MRTARVLSLAACLLIGACGSASEPVTDTTTAGQPAALDVAACARDAQAGIDAAALGIAAADDLPLVELVDGGWTVAMAGDAAFEAALERARTTEATCLAREVFSVVAIDRADEITPASINQAVVWLDTFGPLTEMARLVPPALATDYIEIEPALPALPPAALDHEAIGSCDELERAITTQLEEFLTSWDALTPAALADTPLPVDLGVEIQQARLRGAELGCNVLDLSTTALVALATTASRSFVGRGQRITYASWLLNTMVAPYADESEGVIAQPIGGADGLAGYSILNRTERAVTGLTLALDGEPVVEGETLGAGESRWVPHHGGGAMPGVSLSWDR